MGLMGIFLFVTMGVIYIHGKEGRLSPMARAVLLRYMARVLLLGDLTKEKQASDGTGEAGLTDHQDVVLTNIAFATSCEDPEMTREESEPPKGPESTGSPGFRQLIASMDEMTKAVNRGTESMTEGMTELKNEMEELTKAVKSEEVVSDYTLLAKVLDRLCLVLYVISIAAAIPMTMYLSK
ncbi:uncharacterized protein [Branchiostoma lanceolatum]|uniref:uncharacterized protein n=1 Tax=Branchiostoma lanceolatum TaxID=7740 RepID=UPI003451AAA4